MGVQLDLVSLGAYHEASEHNHPLLPGRHVCSGCSLSWGKEIGLVQVASEVTTNLLKCSAPFTLAQLGMCSCSSSPSLCLWWQKPLEHRHERTPQEQSEPCILLSAQTKGQDRGLSLPQHPPVLPSNPVKWTPERPNPWGCKVIWKFCTADQLCGPCVKHWGSHYQSHVVFPVMRTPERIQPGIWCRTPR